MRRNLAIFLCVVTIASACSSDDDPSGGEPGGSTFGRILAGERAYIPDPNNPEIEDNPCFGLSGRDPLQALECPLVDLGIPGDVLVLGPIDTAEPDLVIASHQTAVIDEDNVVHVVTIRNIGSADAVIDEVALGDADAHIQFYASATPVLDAGTAGSYEGAGGTMLAERTLEPGDEFELVYPAGSGVPDGFDYTDFNYDIGVLTGSPANDANPDNNVSVTPLIPAP